MRTKQTGFAALESLLILIIISIIGGTGYFVWHSKNQASSALNNASNINQSTSFSNKSTSTKISNTSQGYLIVKEWGIRLKITPPISDIYYTIHGEDAVLGLSSLDKLTMKDGSACKPDQNSMVSLSRNTPAEYQDFLKSSGYQDTATHIGSYYYLETVADPPVPPCAYDANGQSDPSVMAKVQAEITAAGTMEALPQ